MTDPALDTILSGDPPAFALVYRPSVAGDGVAEILHGESTTYTELAEVEPRPDRETLLLVPYRQVAERGFDAVDDGAALVGMTITSHTTIPLADLVAGLPNDEVHVEGGGFETDRTVYMRQVREIIEEEIGRGEGSNFVVKRSYTGQIVDYTLRAALSFFRRLVEHENGAYWTFLVHTGERVLVGASPERHLTCHDGVAVMNPISGTYRYPPDGPDIDGLVDFLNDRKETDELNMVVDEELKMMARICDHGASVTGPLLKEMAHLAHTEYYIHGKTSLPAVSLIRESLFAPTVVGSPLENAFRVIARREESGRGYYSGCVALIGHDETGRETLDSAILIRTAEIDQKGRIDIGVGATLVRHSDPASEVAECESKVAGLLNVLDGHATPRREKPAMRGLGALRPVLDGLTARNVHLARFWFQPDFERRPAEPRFRGRRVLVLDAEDTFTAMLAHQLRALGLEVTVREVNDDTLGLDELENHDFVLLGPGPGDPRDETDPKIARMRKFLLRIRDAGIPLLAVCLGHQVLCRHLGLEVVRLDTPNQGAQKEIELFDRTTRVGFYNTFVAVSETDRFPADGLVVEASRHARTGHVYALRAPGVRSMQFHPESILTPSGVELLADCVDSLVPDPRRDQEHR